MNAFQELKLTPLEESLRDETIGLKRQLARLLKGQTTELWRSGNSVVVTKNQNPINKCLIQNLSGIRLISELTPSIYGEKRFYKLGFEVLDEFGRVFYQEEQSGFLNLDIETGVRYRQPQALNKELKELIDPAPLLKLLIWAPHLRLNIFKSMEDCPFQTFLLGEVTRFYPVLISNQITLTPKEVVKEGFMFSCRFDQPNLCFYQDRICIIHRDSLISETSLDYLDYIMFNETMMEDTQDSGIEILFYFKTDHKTIETHIEKGVGLTLAKNIIQLLQVYPALLPRVPILQSDALYLQNQSKQMQLFVSIIQKQLKLEIF